MDEQAEVIDELIYILKDDPDTDYIDISGRYDTHYLNLCRQIYDFNAVYDVLRQYPNLKELNVCDNLFTHLPMNLSGMKNLANLNLNGNQFGNFNNTVLALKSLPSLRSVYLNLYQEEQVDYIMRTLEELDFLNGLKVERDILYDDEEEEE